MNVKNQKAMQTKLTKGLLDMIILEQLQKENKHGYQLITSIRKGFGVYFGPSTIYPLLNQMEKKGYLKSAWNMSAERPRKEYTLTEDGKGLLNLTENSLAMICHKINPEISTKPQTPLSLIMEHQ
jgi:PadR family transcriptional regulator PadR